MADSNIENQEEILRQEQQTEQEAKLEKENEQTVLRRMEEQEKEENAVNEVIADNVISENDGFNKVFHSLGSSLQNNANFEVESDALREPVAIFPGSTGKSGIGIRHIIEERFSKDNLSDNEITALTGLIIDSVQTGKITRDSEYQSQFEKNGIIAIARKEFFGEKETWLLTGFAYDSSNAEKNREATEAIKTVIAKYGSSPDYSYFRKQVGAVIASLNQNIPQNEILSTENLQKRSADNSPFFLNKNDELADLQENLDAAQENKIPVIFAQGDDDFSVNERKTIYDQIPQIFDTLNKTFNENKNKNENSNENSNNPSETEKPGKRQVWDFRYKGIKIGEISSDGTVKLCENSKLEELNLEPGRIIEKINESDFAKNPGFKIETDCQLYKDEYEEKFKRQYEDFKKSQARENEIAGNAEVENTETIAAENTAAESEMTNGEEMEVVEPEEFDGFEENSITEDEFKEIQEETSEQKQEQLQSEKKMGGDAAEKTDFETEEYWKNRFISDNAETFSAVDEYLDNGVRPKGETFIFSRTPEILQFTGIPDNEIIFTTKVLNKAQKVHHLSNDEIKSALASFSSPLFVFDSNVDATENRKNSVIFIADSFSAAQKPLAVTLNIDSETERNRKKIVVNEIRSVHDRTVVAKNGVNIFEEWARNGLCRYVDDKKISEWQLAAGEQFPLAVLHSDTNNIKQFSDFVNSRNNEQKHNAKSKEIADEMLSVSDYDVNLFAGGKEVSFLGFKYTANSEDAVPDMLGIDELQSGRGLKLEYRIDGEGKEQFLVSEFSENTFDAKVFVDGDYQSEKSERNCTFPKEIKDAMRRAADEYTRENFGKSLAEQFQAENEMNAALSEIEAYCDNGTVPKDGRFILPNAPEYLQRIGSDDTEITLPVSVVKKAMETHGLTKEEVMSAVYGLYDPVLAFDSDKSKTENRADSQLILTNGFKDGKPFALAVNKNAIVKLYDSNIDTEVQDIRSIHDRTLVAKNGTDLIQKWTENGLCRYVDDKKIAEWSSLARVYFPVELLQSADNKILQKSDIVNDKKISDWSKAAGVQFPLAGLQSDTSNIKQFSDFINSRSNAQEHNAAPELKKLNPDIEMMKEKIRNGNFEQISGYFKDFSLHNPAQSFSFLANYRDENGNNILFLAAKNPNLDNKTLDLIHQNIGAKESSRLYFSENADGKIPLEFSAEQKFGEDRNVIYKKNFENKKQMLIVPKPFTAIDIGTQKALEYEKKNNPQDFVKENARVGVISRKILQNQMKERKKLIERWNFTDKESGNSQSFKKTGVSFDREKLSNIISYDFINSNQNGKQILDNIKLAENKSGLSIIESSSQNLTSLVQNNFKIEKDRDYRIFKDISKSACFMQTADKNERTSEFKEFPQDFMRENNYFPPMFVQNEKNIFVAGKDEFGNACEYKMNGNQVSNVIHNAMNYDTKLGRNVDFSKEKNIVPQNHIDFIKNHSKTADVQQSYRSSLDVFEKNHAKSVFAPFKNEQALRQKHEEEQKLKKAREIAYRQNRKLGDIER